MHAAKVGKRGAIVVPAKLRKRFGLDEGSFVIAEATFNPPTLPLSRNGQSAVLF